jgi:hypothetical protein
MYDLPANGIAESAIEGTARLRRSVIEVQSGEASRGLSLSMNEILDCSSGANPAGGNQRASQRGEAP